MDGSERGMKKDGANSRNNDGRRRKHEEKDEEGEEEGRIIQRRQDELWKADCEKGRESIG